MVEIIVLLVIFASVWFHFMYQSSYVHCRKILLEEIVQNNSKEGQYDKEENDVRLNAMDSRLLQTLESSEFPYSN